MLDTKRFEALKEEIRPEGDETLIHAEIPQEDLAAMSGEQADELVALFGSTTLIRLPEREREFFDWLRAEDPAVWEDLWGDTPPDELYYVSIAHLTSFLPGTRGFPVCDLVNNDNYWFTENDLTPEEGKIFVEHALDVVAEQGDLSMDQAFAIEVWRGPIDQWRFAWMYNIPLAEVRKMVHWLITEGVLQVPQQRSEDDAPIESHPPRNGSLPGDGDSGSL